MLGTTSLLAMKRLFNEAKTSSIVPASEIPVHVVCDDDPNNRKWFDIIGAESSGDSIRICVTKHKPTENDSEY